MTNEKARERLPDEKSDAGFPVARAHGVVQEEVE